MEGEPMIGEAAIRGKLEDSAGLVAFDDLRAHLERDAVFVVAATLSLVECGVRVAMDDVALVGRWLESQELRKPSHTERATWPEDPDRRWMALVVQPFVLVQDPLH